VKHIFGTNTFFAMV